MYAKDIAFSHLSTCNLSKAIRTGYNDEIDVVVKQDMFLDKVRQTTTHTYVCKSRKKKYPNTVGAARHEDPIKGPICSVLLPLVASLIRQMSIIGNRNTNANSQLIADVM